MAVRADLEGVIPPVVTPFSSSGELDLEGLIAQLTWLGGRGLSGVLALGSTGEAPLLDEGERREVVTCCAEHREEGAFLLAGTGAESTRGAIRLSRDAGAAGADACLVVNPAYYKGAMTTDALVAHYEAVADSSEVPILLYSVPKFTGMPIPPDAVERLALHPNIIGLKDSSGDLRSLHAFLERTPPDFAVIEGASLILGAAVQAGAAGAILAVANFCPDLCVALHDAARAGENDRVNALQTELNVLTRRIQGAYGIPGLKVAAGLLGGAGGFPRPPLRPLSAEGTAAVQAALAEAGSVPSHP